MTWVAVAQRQGGRHLSRWLLRCVKVFTRATTGFSSTHPRWGVQGPPSTGGCFCKPPVSTIFYHGMVNLRGDQAIARSGMAELRITSAGWVELWTCGTFTTSPISRT